jgi:GrpB-like predicted nucleotidyltransferase (UPF0157 family)
LLVVPYDTQWPRLFEGEREVLEEALAPWLDGGIHHIGSTAVPGLPAKPIIDMLAGVRDLAESRAAEEPLAALGYSYREHRPEGHLFVKDGYGVHLTEPGSDLWRERLAFRDALRAEPELAREYADWKRVHAGEHSYTGDKRPLVTKALARAGIEVKPDEERLTTAPKTSTRRSRTR